MMNKTVRNTIGKREVNSIINKISEKVVSLKNVEEVEKLIFNIVPDAIEVGNEIYNFSNDEEFVVSGTIPRDYTGKHQKSEFLEVEEDFVSLEKFKTVDIIIYKYKDYYEIVATASFNYTPSWCELCYGTLNLKREVVRIPLEYRTEEIEKIKKDILGLSSGTMAILIAKENVGSASSKYLLIDEIQKKFFEYTISNIETTNVVPSDWTDSWNCFKRNNDIKEIAYNLGFDKSEVEPNYEIYHRYDNEISELKGKLKSYLESNINDISQLPKDILKDLAYAYAIEVLKMHCINNNKNAIDKVLNNGIKAIMNDEYDDKQYLEYATYGYKYLQKC